MPELAILRVAKVKNGTVLLRLGRHHERTRQPSNADPSRADQNRLLVIGHGEVHERVEARIAHAAPGKHRKDAVRALDIFCGVSPTWRGNAEQWAADSLAFLQRKFGVDNTIAATLHRDEKTPHLHAIIVPIYEGRLRASHWLDGPQKLTELQDAYHAAVARHGLGRGERGSQRRHIPMSALHTQGAIADSIIVSATDSMPSQKFLESSEMHRERVREHLRPALAPLAENAVSGHVANFRINEAHLQAKNERARRILAETERDELRNRNMERLRALELTEVARRILGMEPRREGSSWVFETEAMKLIITGQKYKDFRSDARGDGGAISLAKHLLGCDFAEAVRWLTSEFRDDRAGVVAEVRHEYERQAEKTVASVADRPVTLAEKMDKHARCNVAKNDVVRRYLSEKRAIPFDVVEQAFARGDIWANDFGSACFARRDANGQIIGVSIRGTLGCFKQCIGSKSSGFFAVSGTSHPHTVAVVESPIDALSYHALTGSTTYSTDGLASPEPLVEHLQSCGVQMIFAAQDNDAAGNEQAESLSRSAEAHGLSCERQLPTGPGKDWNEVLCQLRRLLAPALAWTANKARELAEKLADLGNGIGFP